MAGDLRSLGGSGYYAPALPFMVWTTPITMVSSPNALGFLSAGE